MDQNDYQNQIEQERVEQLKRQILSGMLTKDAYERLARVRSVNPNLAGNAELYLLQAYQSGQVKGTINDDQLKELLGAISSGTSRDFKIKRK